MMVPEKPRTLKGAHTVLMVCACVCVAVTWCVCVCVCVVSVCEGGWVTMGEGVGVGIHMPIYAAQLYAYESPRCPLYVLLHI
jgi:hypothetical protein